jgi:hypothetical protein
MKKPNEAFVKSNMPGGMKRTGKKLTKAHA